MLSESQASENPPQVLISERFLIALFETGARFAESQEGVLHWWGLHLLEDWKSLSLLAQAQTRIQD